MNYSRHTLLLLLLVAGFLWSTDGWAQQKGKKTNGSTQTTKTQNDGDEASDDGEEGADAAEGGETMDSSTSSMQRGSRMDFDGRLIRGQHAGAGAVFLFERVPRHLPSMVDKRRTYLRETVRRVLGAPYASSFDAARHRAADLEERKNSRDSKDESDD